MEKRYLKAEEAAEYMSVHPNTVKKYCKLWGALVKIGRASRYDRQVIDARMNNIVRVFPEG